MMAAPTGYGPSNELGSRWNHLCCNREEKNYELWETKFLAPLCLLNLKSTILNELPGEDAADDACACTADDAEKNKQGDEKLSFTEFKTKLGSYESTEKFNAVCSDDDSVMKVREREIEQKMHEA